MVNTYTGKSPRNARIKIDYTGECPTVKFKYPRKDGFVGSMFPEVFMIWIIILALVYSAFCIGVGMTEIKYTQNDSNESITNQTQLENYSCKSVYYFDFVIYQKTWKEKLIVWFQGIKDPLLFTLIVFFPPFLINKIFKKQLNALFPIWQAYKAKKKYVKFKSKDVKTTTINGKKEIYVEIPYFKNVVLKYEATKDFSKYLDIMEIEEQNFQTEEKPGKKDKKKAKKRKGKKSRIQKIKKRNEWFWYAKFYFNKVPKTGSLDVIFN